jgi:hypothetical protein
LIEKGLRLKESSPEKAGVGGSTPSLATIEFPADKGASSLTEPLDNHGWEWRCYMRDPDGYLIEVGQHIQRSLDLFKNEAS